MPADKYTAVWVSHTSISDFLKCPRSYYLKNMYKDPQTKHKVKLMSPPLALGQSVHEVLESLSTLPRTDRFKEPLMDKFERAWAKVSGKKGGFINEESEYKYKKRGMEMLRRVWNNPGPVAGLAVKIQTDLPHCWLSEEEGILLCGKIDWLEYLQDQDAVHIIDFKTGKFEEDSDSLQLPIYNILVTECQKRKVVKASYWYLESQDTLTEKTLPDLVEAKRKVLEAAKQIKLARQINRFKCPKGDDGCFACKPYEAILKHEAEFVGNDEYNYDVYIFDMSAKSEEMESVIL